MNFLEAIEFANVMAFEASPLLQMDQKLKKKKYFQQFKMVQFVEIVKLK
jgi:hypothetical protein